MSVGRIEGGESVNVVPDWCEIEVDRRLIPGEDAADSLRDAREWLGTQLPARPAFRIQRTGRSAASLGVGCRHWLEPLTRRDRNGHRPPARRCEACRSAPTPAL